MSSGCHSQSLGRRTRQSVRAQLHPRDFFGTPAQHDPTDDAWPTGGRARHSGSHQFTAAARGRPLSAGASDAARSSARGQRRALAYLLSGLGLLLLRGLWLRGLGRLSARIRSAARCAARGQRLIVLLSAMGHSTVTASSSPFVRVVPNCHSVLPASGKTLRAARCRHEAVPMLPCRLHQPQLPACL